MDLCYFISGGCVPHDLSELEDTRGIKWKSIKIECVKKIFSHYQAWDILHKTPFKTAKLPRDTKTSEDPIYPLRQVLLSLPTDTTTDAFYHLSGNISDFSDQNKQTVTAEIVRKWG